jgi:hypothetical protein
MKALVLPHVDLTAPNGVSNLIDQCKSSIKEGKVNGFRAFKAGVEGQSTPTFLPPCFSLPIPFTSPWYTEPEKKDPRELIADLLSYTPPFAFHPFRSGVCRA